MYAFISVYDKKGIEKFARELRVLGWEIFSSVGTAKYLKEHDVAVKDIAEIIGTGEMLNHKVVTLDRKFHAMLLADGSKEETAELQKLGLSRIDLVCCDFYPQFEINQTDIGGPTMIRSATKGRRIVICDKNDRNKVIAWLKKDMPDRIDFVASLWRKAEFLVAKYVLESACRIGGKTKCAYGENKWQTNAYFYEFPNDDPLGIDKFKLIEGGDRSYINFTDTDRLLQTAAHIAAGFKKNTGKIPRIALGAKHGNVCGAGIGANAADVLKKMLSGDPQAISGGWVLVNFKIEKNHALLLRHDRILDGVVAPAFSGDAVEILARKSGKCRMLVNPALGTNALANLDKSLRFRHMRGGFLTQSNYMFVPDLKGSGTFNLKVPDPFKKDLLLAWAVGSTSNSNTITIAKNGMLLANATGQQSRVLACRLALMIARTAGHNLKNAVAYSDSFFPFVDGPKVLVRAGIKTLFTTSGSIRDKEVFAFLKSRGVKVVTLSDQQARGFFGH